MGTPIKFMPPEGLPESRFHIASFGHKPGNLLTLSRDFGDGKGLDELDSAEDCVSRLMKIYKECEKGNDGCLSDRIILSYALQSRLGFDVVESWHAITTRQHSIPFVIITSFINGQVQNFRDGKYPGLSKQGFYLQLADDVIERAELSNIVHTGLPPMINSFSSYTGFEWRERLMSDATSMILYYKSGYKPVWGERYE